MHPAIEAARRYGFESGLTEVNGLRLHHVRHGQGMPLLLLHGWPEFWLSWRKLMPRLEHDFTMLAPDLRGFGATGKPDVGPSRGVGADVHAVDMLALLDALGIGRVGIVSHDVGAYVAQAMARKAPERIGGLFFFDCPYPGIGHRWAAPRHLGEIWYQSFHQQPWAADLVGATRGALSTYLGHFLRHWAHRKDAFDEDLETWLDVYAMPGNLQGGFDWYLSAAEARLAVIEERAARPEPIRNPTRVLWGRHDPILKADWADRLPEYFPDLSLSFCEGSGHFPHMEEPDAAAADIRSFFRGLVSGAG